MNSAHEEVQGNLDCDEAFQQDVFWCVSYITHKSPLMQGLFAKWIALTPREQALLNYISFHIYDKSEMLIYSGIIKGIHFWNTVQDTEGACGYHKSPLEFRFNKEQEKRIFNVILDIDNLISTMKKKSEVCKQINGSKVTHLNYFLMLLQMYAQGDR